MGEPVPIVSIEEIVGNRGWVWGEGGQMTKPQGLALAERDRVRTRRGHGRQGALHCSLNPVGFQRGGNKQCMP